jgi:hypothetical protein
MTVRFVFGFWCGLSGRLGTTYLKREFRDFPIPQIGSTIAIGDSNSEYSSKVDSVVIDPETREVSVSVLPVQFAPDKHEEYLNAVEFMKQRGWD